MKRLLLVMLALAAVLFPGRPAAAQTGLVEQPSEFVRTAEGDMFFRFYGHAGRTYFIQISDPNDPLVSWHWAPVIEAGNDEFICYEVDGTSPHGFFRLQYTDEVPPPGVSLEDWDIDGDGRTNLQEIENQLEGTNPMDADTDGDGTPDGADSAPNDPGSGGTAIRGEIESRWNHVFVANSIVVSGAHIAIFTGASGTDSTGGGWVTQQEGYEDLAEAEDFAAVAQAASGFPLPESWEDKMRGLEWSNVEEQPHDWNVPPFEFTDIPYKPWRAGRLEHRMRLNRKSPADGYEVPFQVLKLHWTRAAAPGSPWTAGAGNASIIKTFTFAKGEILSAPASYDPITTVATNQAVTLHAVRFEEVEPESGFDDQVRLLPEQRSELPWLAVANSATEETPPNATVKLHFSPGEWPLQLTVDVPAPHSATVTPDTVSGDEAVVLTIEGSNTFVLNENSYEGTLNIEGVPVLNLAFYRRRPVTLAVHEITLINDDVETEYVKVSGSPAEPVAMGHGKPNTTCIAKGPNNIADTQIPGGDDELWLGGIVRTGPNGICETTAAGDDEQVIPVGKGEPGATIVTAGPNNVLNTAPNAHNANMPAGNAGIHNPQDDTVAGTTIHTGADGLRQTPMTKPSQPPVNVPAQAAMQEYLDRILGKQANLWFEIVSWNTADAAFDVAATTDYDANFPNLAAPNHCFDFFSSAEDSVGNPVLSKEEQIVQTASKDPDARYNLYYIPSPLRQRGLTLSGNQIGGPGGIPSIGYARSFLRTPYISAYDPRKGGNQSPAILLLHAAAHEIAHSAPFQARGDMEGRLYHPREERKDPATGKGEWLPDPENPGKGFPLWDEQSDRLRLMWGAYQMPRPETGRPPGLLLKHEADSLHQGNQ